MEVAIANYAIVTELALFSLDIRLSKDARGWLLPRCRDERPRSGVMGLSGAAAAGPLAPGQRWSVARKRAVVLRLIAGEPVELVSREIGVPVFKLELLLPPKDRAGQVFMMARMNCLGDLYPRAR